MKRSQFILGTGLSAVIAPRLIHQLSDPEPQMDKALVQEFVRVAHSDKDKVVGMLEAHPNLLNSAHDWKYGDFETALGAANHVGYKELITYLLDKGAQANIFTACVFGKMEIVKAYLEAFPKSLYAKGAHGFTLLHHAVRGGDEGLEVKVYLEFLGLRDLKYPLY